MTSNRNNTTYNLTSKVTNHSHPRKMSLSNSKDDTMNPAEILGSMKRTLQPYSAITAFDKNKKKRKTTPPPRPPPPASSVSDKTPKDKNSKDKSPKTEDTATLQSRAASNPTTSTDIYDAMLGEISDLLMAAQQAQSLGRLKMASTYQLLVHARLVGLGKRFDRFLAHGNGNSQKTSAERSLTFPPVSNNDQAAANKPATGGGGGGESDEANDMKIAQETLAKILPNEVDLDNTMMEHLARAAMELHNKRTGRGMLHERTEAKKTIAETSAATAPGGGVAWTDEEKARCLRAAENFGRDKYDAIAFAVGTRSPAEVKAHLKNVSGREKVQRNLASEGVKKEGGVGAGVAGDGKAGGDALVTPEKQRRGRGKKPPDRKSVV